MALQAKLHTPSPLLKYPGGKEKELKYILPSLPPDARYYYEPFVGSGAVYQAIEAEKYYINDKSIELMGLYRMIDHEDSDFFRLLTAMTGCWDFLAQLCHLHEQDLLMFYLHLRDAQAFREEGRFTLQLFLTSLQSSLPRLDIFQSFPEEGLLTDPAFWAFAEKSFCNKLPRMLSLEKSHGLLSEADILANLECALKTAFYLHIRERYNALPRTSSPDGTAIALYYFLREYCYSSMFRYNRNGKFNVPYGGISYNKKSLAHKLEILRGPDLRSQLSRTVYTEMDFEDFAAEFVPEYQDFVFVDPPYDTEFASYDGLEFAREDHKRLASWLKEACLGYFMLIIKNTEFIRDLYPEGLLTASGRPLYVTRFDKKYFVSFKSRNDKQAEHLMITNYPVAADISFLSEGT